MTPAETRYLSETLEVETGYDSIRTIERVYDRTSGGAYCCVFPDCDFTRRDAVAMWLHVHFTLRHGLSFGVRSPDDMLLAAIKDPPAPAGRDDGGAE